MAIDPLPDLPMNAHARAARAARIRYGQMLLDAECDNQGERIDRMSQQREADRLAMWAFDRKNGRAVQ